MSNYDVKVLGINSFFRYICVDDWIWPLTGEQWPSVAAYWLMEIYGCGN